MFSVEPVTPTIGAVVSGFAASDLGSDEVNDAVYQSLLDHIVIFVRGLDISPEEHLRFASRFGDLDAPHRHYPHAPGFDQIVRLENDASKPPDTNSWHTDLTFKAEQPFASVLLARHVPVAGGDTLWSSCYAAYERLSEGMKTDLEGLEAIHDLGDFRNILLTGKEGEDREALLNEGVSGFGHQVRPLIDSHPVTGRKFLNFNEAFTTHILGLTTSDAKSLSTYLSNHMNCPEDQLRWRWSAGDLALWDNRVSMHYAVADYMPHYRCMDRVTIVRDRRA